MVLASDKLREHAGKFARELTTAAQLACEAGQIALRYHRQEFAVDLKAGNEPVTIADHECSAHIVEGLSKAFPDDVVISEEVADDSRRLQAKRVWYVDPIDGTKAFIRGEHGFCVMVGLTVEQQPALGVLCQPNFQRLAFAVQGEGAWALRGEQCIQMKTSDLKEPAQARYLGKASKPQADWERIETILGLNINESINSIGLKLCTIAMGASDLHANPKTRCSSWDTCAPQIILEEAGGKLTDLQGNALRYDEANTTRHSRGIIASNGTMHEQVIKKFAVLYGKAGPA